MKKILTASVLLLLLLAVALTLSSCFGDGGDTTTAPATTEPTVAETGWGTVFTLETAFARAQSLGYTGTLEAFLESIKGKDGATIQAVAVRQGHLYVTVGGLEIDCGVVVGPAGEDGETPYIGENGNWWIGDTDTGERAGVGELAVLGTSNGNGYYISGLLSLPSRELVLPDTYGGKPVVGVTSNFSKNYYAPYVRSLTLTSVGDIQEDAFANMIGLNELILPAISAERLASLIELAFSGCSSLQYATVDGVRMRVYPPAAKPEIPPPLRTDGQELMHFYGKTVSYRQGSVHTLTVSGRPSYLEVRYFLIGEDGSKLPFDGVTDAGVYTVRAEFFFVSNSYVGVYALPDPMQATLTVSKAAAPVLTLSAPATVYYTPGCNPLSDPASGREGLLTLTGTLPADLTVDYRCTDESGNVYTAADELLPGRYTVTATVKEAAGKQNYLSLPTLTASVTVRQAAQIKQYTPTLDGVLDEAYLQSAYFPFTYDATQSAAEYCILQKKSGFDAAEPGSITGGLYVLWDGAYIYVFATVTDPTSVKRSEAYADTVNPWLNDVLELYYSFGGDPLPRIPAGQDTYPTYKGVSVDAYGYNVTAVDAQRSAFFDQLEVRTTHTESDGGITYHIEYKFPAKNESATVITAGEFATLAVQINDLTAWPSDVDPADPIPTVEKYPSGVWVESNKAQEWVDYDAKFAPYMQVSSSRHAANQATFLVLQFASEAVTE